jgi:SAM-dependent methyltransferase
MHASQGAAPAPGRDGFPRGDATFSPEIPRAARYNRWVVEAFRGYYGKSVLEVGFGHGSARTLLGHEIQYVGVDLDALVVEQARRDDPTGTFVAADICEPDFTAALVEFRFDTVLCVNVIEHLADDRAGVAHLLDVLEPGGHLLLLVPALPALYNDLDRLAGHHRRYRKLDVGRLVPTERASIKRLEYFNPIGAVGWWLNGFTGHDSLASAQVGRQVRLFDRYAIPASRALNRVTRGWFGQSVLCVAERD